MSNLFNMARVEAQDSSGGVLAGAKLEFFETGTSTNLDTYSDDALTTANANPVVADSAGRWGAIFLRDQKYKVTLSDSDDVQIWSADPVDGGLDNLADDTIRSTLDTTGSSNAYALTVNRVITAYANGDPFVAKANFQNTGAATLNITGGQSGASALGAKTIKKNHDLDLASGDIESGQWCVWRYDGTNMQLISPTAVSATGSPITTRGDLVVGDSSGTDARLAVGASDTWLLSGGLDPVWVASASQAEQEAGTVTNRVVTPGRQHFHQSAAKGWVKFNLAGTDAASYNVTSITDTGTGDWTVNWATDFSGANYSVVATLLLSATATRDVNARAVAAGTTQIISTDATDSLVETNVSNIFVQAFGDQ